MKVSEMTVGPIIGATTHNSARLFGRGDLQLADGKPRRAHGVVRVRKALKNATDDDYSKPQYFKLNPNFDMTGITIVKGLDPKTKYHYQMGWIYSEVDTEHIGVNSLLDWSGVTRRAFHSGSADAADPRSIAVGSCRYVLRLFGGAWFDDRGDKTFGSIFRQATEGDGLDQVIMCGDQIYADDLNIIGADDALDEFNRRYRNAFTTRMLRKLMSRVPTYMTLDDHEIEDNWPESAESKDWVKKFPAAIHAYSTYQLSHSPLFKAQAKGKIAGTPTHLWYTYQDGCTEVFVTDTRTERWLEPPQREMIGPNQLKSLLAWLKKDNGRVKIVVTSVPFYESDSRDKWEGFVEQRDTILETIRSNSVRKVIFVSGDVHASMVSELKLDGDPDFKVLSVVSSAFFWPYPHPKRRSFRLKGTIPTKMEPAPAYRVSAASGIHATDSFARLDIRPQGVKVGFYARKGGLLEEKEYGF